VIEKFLEEVGANHQAKVSDEVLQEALLEIRAHLEESRQAFVASGYRVDQAEEMAVKAFGDPSLAVKKPHPFLDWSLSPRCRETVITLAVGYGLCLAMMPLQFHLPPEALFWFAIGYWVFVPYAVGRAGFRARRVFPSAIALHSAIFIFILNPIACRWIGLPLDAWRMGFSFFGLLSTYSGVQAVGAGMGLVLDARRLGRSRNPWHPEVKS